MPEERYEYDAESYAILGSAGIPWPQADFLVRYGNPVIRRFIADDLLSIIGRDMKGEWLAVLLVEDELVDDLYVVRHARRLTPEEIDAATAQLGGGLHHE